MPTALHISERSSKLILVPHPSENDPNDPLRWPRWKKHVCFMSICAFTFLTNFAIGGLAPAFYILSIQFNKSLTETSDLLLWPILVLGVFNFFWVPMANYFGKRPIFCFASLLLCLCDIWGAVATSFRSLLWSTIIAAFAGSSTEALGAAMVNDLYFLHERSSKMGIYMNFISGGNTIGPLICGFVITGATWRWHKWISVILTAINFVAVVLFVPETRYDRSSMPLATTESDLALPSALDKEVDQLPKKTWLQELSLWSGTAKDTNLFEMFVRPLPMLAYPAVMFAFLGYAVSLAWVAAINILNSFILQAPPYNWKPSINGLINIPGLLGNLFGAFTSGWVVDRYSDWRAKKNNGVFQPETRLFMLIIPTIIVPAGCILFGYGVERTLHWTSLFFGYGMVSVGLTAVPVIGMTYVSDSYFPVAPDALLLVNGLKNIVAFGFLWGVVPWVTEVGYVASFWTQAAIFLFIMALAIPLSIFGEKIRHTSAQWRIIL
ncbi:MFS general substrate transporter [Rhizodiscina lignyota]|uniref:MFS general substrate transporter n=1 Tax=Rhizodiscina lignyota TaxID=1504668 RepID=A0A9P4MC00_9PEZI|nr:MFS general substrate transporter [Rhizodiscina lignyota]